MDIDWLLVTVAIAVGTLVGLTGVGAGAIMTPVLVGFFGVSLPVAIATDLVFATVTKLMGVPFHHRQGSINWKMVKQLWRGSIPGTLIGVVIVLFFASEEHAQWLAWPLVALVLLTAFTLGYRAIRPDRLDKLRLDRKPLHPVIAPAGGFGIGGAVALTSVGAGALGMALLVRLSPPGVKPRELVGTDLVHAIPIAMIAGLAYGAAGLISWPTLANLLLGSVPGVIIGSVLAGKVSRRILNAGLSLIMLAATILVTQKILG